MVSIRDNTIEPEAVSSISIAKKDQSGKSYSRRYPAFVRHCTIDCRVTEGPVSQDSREEVFSHELGVNQESHQHEDVPRSSLFVKKKLFLAYSYLKEDEELVAGMKRILQRYYVVTDGKTSHLGSVSRTVIDKIKQADIAIFVMTHRDRKVNSEKFTTSSWLIEEKGAALALEKPVAILVESGVDVQDIGGLHGDRPLLTFTRNNFSDVVATLLEMLENSVV